MFLALYVLNLCLWMAACPECLVPTPVVLARVETGGGGTSTCPVALPLTSGAAGGGNGGGSSTSGLPQGVALGTGSEAGGSLCAHSP